MPDWFSCGIQLLCVAMIDDSSLSYCYLDDVVVCLRGKSTPHLFTEMPGLPISGGGDGPLLLSSYPLLVRDLGSSVAACGGLLFIIYGGGILRRRAPGKDAQQQRPQRPRQGQQQRRHERRQLVNDRRSAG